MYMGIARHGHFDRATDPETDIPSCQDLCRLLRSSSYSRMHHPSHSHLSASNQRALVVGKLSNP